MTIVARTSDRGALRPGGPRLRPDVVCLSHLRWNFVFQRPQHLLTRCAKGRRVFFFEEPIESDGKARLEIAEPHPGVRVMTPHLPQGLDEPRREAAQRELLNDMLLRHGLSDYVLWYYTPMALPFTHHLAPAAILYDCMDELSAFAGAPAMLREREAELFRRADVVLTGGHSLYEAKRGKHPNVHPFPSSVDVKHFQRARGDVIEPVDQASIPHPRLGFFGVIDERMDIELLAAMAARRPDFHFVMLGPVVKIDPATLPRLPNIHYLGRKSYEELPIYLAGWDVALLPFAKNASTQFISPTKTPEYLAAGKPVVSTSIRDVVRPYGELGLVRIADTPDDFISAVDACLEDDAPNGNRDRAVRRREAMLESIDRFLSQTSWDGTWARIEALLTEAISVKGRGIEGKKHV